MRLRGQLLQYLADGEFHSGAALGEILGVSRMAVWKHLSALRALGVTCESVRGKGYRLTRPCELLSHERILDSLGVSARERLHSLELLLETASTNTHLRDRALTGAASGTVCLAEMQTAGRGRHGRAWVSPFASNLYLSLLWRTPLGAAALGGLSLAVGVGVLRTLQDHGVRGIGLKWPNDVLAGDAKLAGILLDVIGESTGQCAVIIGAGINLRMPQEEGGGIDQPWTDLATLLGGVPPSRNRLAADLVTHLFAVLDDFERAGLQSFRDEWLRHDVLAGHPVRLAVPHGEVQGIARGIDSDGALLLETGIGTRERFTAGEISLRVYR